MKLLPFSIVTIGVAVAALILCFGIFNYWIPNNTEAGYFNAYRDKLQAEANKLSAQRKKVEEAKQFRANLFADWQATVEQRTPEDDVRRGGIDLGVNRYQLVSDSIRFRNSIQSDLNRQLRVGGVTVISAPRVPDFPSSPATIIESGYGFPASPFPVRVYDFGQVIVEGTRQQIERNVESWSRMPNYIAVVDGLTYEGTAPKLRATYNLSMLMYLRTKSVFPPAPVGPADAQGGGGDGGGNNLAGQPVAF